MSCHLISKPHIDALVDCFFEGPSDSDQAMLITFPGKNEIGRSLAMENLRNYVWYHSYNTIAERHPERDYQNKQNSIDAWALAEKDDYSACPRDVKEEVEWRKNYTHSPRARKLTLVEALAAMGSWQYSTEDRPGAKESEIAETVQMFCDDYVGCLPGYQEFEEITDENAPALIA